MFYPPKILSTPPSMTAIPMFFMIFFFRFLYEHMNNVGEQAKLATLQPPMKTA